MCLRNKIKSLGNGRKQITLTQKSTNFTSQLVYPLKLNHLNLKTLVVWQTPTNFHKMDLLLQATAKKRCNLNNLQVFCLPISESI